MTAEPIHDERRLASLSTLHLNNIGRYEAARQDELVVARAASEAFAARADEGWTPDPEVPECLGRLLAGCATIALPFVAIFYRPFADVHANVFVVLCELLIWLIALDQTYLAIRSIRALLADRRAARSSTMPPDA